jgi:hypothetical protein
MSQIYYLDVLGAGRLGPQQTTFSGAARNESNMPTTIAKELMAEAEHKFSGPEGLNFECGILQRQMLALEEQFIQNPKAPNAYTLLAEIRAIRNQLASLGCGTPALP